jgi:CheY-like chemotaxis protein
VTAQHHVLIIDDDPDVADAIAEVLDSFGHSSRIARDGAAAFAMLAQGFRPCVILCDEMMPAMSGPQFLDKLRRSDGVNAIPVVSLSAGWLRAENRASPARELAKPFSPAQLEAALDELCRGH